MYNEKIYELGTSARDGKLDDVKELVGDGVNVNSCVGYEGCDKPIDFAAAAGHLDIVEYLVDHGAKIDEGSVTAVYRAARAGKADVVRYLLSKGGHLVCDRTNLAALKRDITAAGLTDLEAEVEKTWASPSSG
jgi:ankyrin repeat protein